MVKGKRWLLLSRWVHLNTDKKRQLNHLFALNRRVMKAYLLKESLERLWSYTYEGAMLRYLQSWIDQLRWQRLKPMGEAGTHVGGPSGRDLELLPNQGAVCRPATPTTIANSWAGSEQTLDSTSVGSTELQRGQFL